jgi:hypothetical protein
VKTDFNGTNCDIMLINPGLTEALNMKLFNRESEKIKLQIIDCDYGPKDMDEQLPISCQPIRMMPGKDSPDYWLAKCDRPVKYGETTVHYLVPAPRFWAQR